MKAKRKAGSNLGMSLAETLLTVLILLLVSTIVAAGIPVARKAYENVLLASDAEVLLSTAAAALRDELATATKVDFSGTTVRYYSADIRSYSEISVDPDKKMIMVKEYIDAAAPISRTLVPVKKNGEDYVWSLTYDSAAPDLSGSDAANASYLIFQNITVTRTGMDHPLASLTELAIRPVSMQMTVDTSG